MLYHLTELILILRVDELSISVYEEKDVFICEIEAVRGASFIVKCNNSDDKVRIVASQEVDRQIALTSQKDCLTLDKLEMVL